MTVLTVLGFDKCQSNELFTVTNKSNKRNNSQGRIKKAKIVLKQARGFRKEYSGICKVFDSTEQSNIELKKLLLPDP